MRKFSTQASQEAYTLARDILDEIPEHDGAIADAIQEAVVSLCDDALASFGDERFYDGEAAAGPVEYERGYDDAREEFDRDAANRSPMAQAWQHRFREAAPGLVAVHDADREAGTLSLVVGEWDAWAILRAVEGAAIAQ